MEAYTKGMRLAIFTFLVLLTPPLFADASSGWRDFNLGAQGGLSNGVFPWKSFNSLV